MMSMPATMRKHRQALENLRDRSTLAFMDFENVGCADSTSRGLLPLCSRAWGWQVNYPYQHPCPSASAFAITRKPVFRDTHLPLSTGTNAPDYNKTSYR